MYVCAINVSEGIDAALLDRLRSATGDICVDVHSDPDHHRSVFTLASRDLEALSAAARSLTVVATDALSIAGHVGVHPRFGVVDVVPFVTLIDEPVARNAVVDAARTYARWAGEELGVPAFLFDLADPLGRSLPEVRRDAFIERMPDFGPREPDPTRGAIAVAAQPPLVAVNVVLAGNDLGVARAIASAIRERDGGLPGVRALGFPLESQGRVQVSMNLTDIDRTGMEAACSRVAELAHERGIEAEEVELVGLIPAREFNRWSDWFREWTGFDDHITVEARVNARAR